MNNHYSGEVWKAVDMKVNVGSDSRIEISNYGRVRTFNKLFNGKIVKGSLINGYPIVRLKLFRQRAVEIDIAIESLKKQIKEIETTRQSGTAIDDNLLQDLKKELNEKSTADIKQRTINFQALIHRLVAEYFLPKPAADQTIVAHMDHNKANNFYRNLKWMTVPENQLHQQRNPQVISNQATFKDRTMGKLTVTRVMLLKKLLGEDKPIKNLAKQFKVTETQILRIKKGENWSDIQAAT